MLYANRGTLKFSKMKIIQYTTHNVKKANRVQSYLKQVSNLEYYQALATAGIIWDLEIISL